MFPSLFDDAVNPATQGAIDETSALLARQSMRAADQLLTWSVDPAERADAHECVTRRALAPRIAALKGCAYGGEAGDAPPASGRVYLVPSYTLTHLDLARRMGIQDEADVFGGVVPHPFMATRAITHGLVDADAQTPHGWVPALALRIQHAVLAGYTAFSEADARLAGRYLLREGSVRVKPVRPSGGRGQSVVRDAVALDRVLAQLPALATDGVVLERNLQAPRTLSVGQCTIGTLCVSYYGVQRLTKDHAGEDVYGGSELTVVRGGFDALCALPLTPALRLAVDQVRACHTAVLASFDGCIASRINYDVAQGRDDAGLWWSGVLEPSWRLGGASGAEIAAMEVFREQPVRQLVQASCVEAYGETGLPPDAHVYYSGNDPVVGRLTKYSLVQAQADAA